MVIPDANIWIDLLNDETLPSSQALRTLIRRQEAVLTGVALSEVLRGARGRDASRAERLLQQVPYVEMQRSAWSRAGRIAADFDAKGQPIPMTVVQLAALAIDMGHELFSRDKHFERIPGLRLYRAEGETT